MLTTFKHLATHNLLYVGDCKLVGITDAGIIYVEELYGADDWLAQHRVSIDEGILETVDEAEGKNTISEFLSLPDDLVQPATQACCKALHFSGARLKGMIADERIKDVVYPLSVADKVAIVQFMEWDIVPPQIIGMAESVVLAYTQVRDDLLIVCRRVRIAYRLTEPTAEYDYDSLDLYILHEYLSKQDEIPNLVDCLNDIDDVVLLRPMDCLYYAGYLYVADGGEGDETSAIHIFEHPIKSEM